ncbi:MAG: response regulator [Deltaproteobacteria bacterium]|nr:response regulator [Deltaproteobacteria bacterium]
MSTILVVDDSPTNRKILQTLLEPLGHTLHFAVNGVDGVRQALACSPDLITLDVEMPYLNGFQTARILSLLEFSIPVVFVTGQQDIQPFVAKSPYAVGSCLKSDLGQKLVPLVENALATSTRKYSDVSYALTQREVLALMATPTRRKILVVDDDPPTADAVALALENTGLYNVFKAVDGREALVKNALLEPDLIISDMVMPGIDGITLAQILYILGRPVPILFFSSQAGDKQIQKGMKLESVRGFFPKRSLFEIQEGFQLNVEKIMGLSPREKSELTNAYQQIDLERLTIQGENRGVLSSGFGTP